MKRTLLVAVLLTSQAAACSKTDSPGDSGNAPPGTCVSEKFAIGPAPSDSVPGARIGAAFLTAVAEKPALGRVFIPGDYQGGTTPVVLISHDVWSDRFRLDARVIGQTLEVNGAPRTIVGVMPKGFAVPAGAKVWLPRQ